MQVIAYENEYRAFRQATSEAQGQLRDAVRRLNIDPGLIPPLHRPFKY